ncbi:MAG: (Fe-S)-binding protein [Desulfobacterales bacterium]|jgi:Fe-S oxidoreductase|nr:(Fe-S)-binding protein [Desulfobacteraceae bacterium]MBT4363720.1 (Fe-S)-binding protein [Desulfobacteraceae bacterium]MBT7086467.1 (Fe-S)-binding protein [Desulfobacterales bacterium]MBT7696194.1 (Fe-S)-binding protein [Desulfobacterales bacterium]
MVKTIQTGNNKLPDTEKILSILNKNKKRMKMYLRICAHCSLCAESCFLYNTKNKDPVYMPSHKVINSIGRLYKKKRKIDRNLLEEVKEIAWKRCVLCTRCYCPLGVDIPSMISLARTICRSQNILPEFHEQS